MNKYVAKSASIVYAGPFGVAPYTHPGWEIQNLLPELIGMQPNVEISADSALGKVFFNTKIDNFVIRASEDRLLIEASQVTENTIAALGKIPERFAAAVPTAMCVGFGFNLSYKLSENVSLVESIMPQRICGIEELSSWSYSFVTKDASSRNIKISCENNIFLVDFNFDLRVATPLSKEAPLIEAKNWVATDSLQNKVSFAEMVLDKMIKQEIDVKAIG